MILLSCFLAMICHFNGIFLSSLLLSQSERDPDGKATFDVQPWTENDSKPCLLCRKLDRPLAIPGTCESL